MKKAFTAVLLFLLLLSLSVHASTDGSVDITVTVPSQHNITVKCGAGGKVNVSGTDYTGTNIFTVERLGSFEVTVVPLEGYEADAVICESGTLIHNGNSVSLEHVNADVTIEVTFKYTVPVISVPVTGKEQIITAGAVVIGDTAKLEVDKSALEQLITSDTGAETVTVDISQIKADINTVVIPAIVINSLSAHTFDNNGQKELEVLFPEAAVVFDTAALNAISGQATEDDITLRIQQIDKSLLTETQQAAVIADSPDTENIIILDIVLHSSDTIISDFNGGSAEVKLPYTPATGEDISTISVWHISPDGSMEQLQCVYKDGFVSFKALHFSNYLIKPGSISVQSNLHCLICRLYGKDISPWCFVITAFLIISIICTVTLIIFIMKSKRNKFK